MRLTRASPLLLDNDYWGIDAKFINKLDVKQALEGFSIRNADGETVDYVMFEDK